MREILFRGKWIDNGEWKEGICIPCNDGSAMIGVGIAANTPIDETAMCITYSVDPETVGQYTGLTDRNGRKIFEGDILQYGEPPETSTYEVVFEAASFVVHSGFFRVALKEGLSERFQVIGNIYDNIDLLEGGESNA